MALVAKASKQKETINFYRSGDKVIGYRFNLPPNPHKPTPTMDMGDTCKPWLEWAKANGYTIDYQGPEA